MLKVSSLQAPPVLRAFTCSDCYHDWPINAAEYVNDSLAYYDRFLPHVHQWRGFNEDDDRACDTALALLQAGF